MTPQDFLDQVITPALAALGLDSIPARQLLLGTALQESGLRDIDQIGGPAQGAFQVEPATRADILHWAAAAHPDWFDVADRLEGMPQEAAICRLIYERAPGCIGATPQEQAAYYKHWYNTPLGKATVEEYLRNWQAAEGVAFDRPFTPAVALEAASLELPGPDLGSVTESVTETVDMGELLPVLQPVPEPFNPEVVE